MERVADYIIRKINEAGALNIFMISGRGILYLTDAVARNNNIKEVCLYHEQGASYAAMANASLTGNISACLVSTGCASTNAVTAALCAYQDNLPVVFISGNNPLNENTRYTGIPIRTYGSQEADIISVVSSITKYSVMITDKKQIAYETEKAIYHALHGRKGPVWIDIPLDVQNMRIDESELYHFTPLNDNIPVYNVDEIVNELNASSRPVVLIGGGARCAAEKIKEFCEANSIPIVFSPAAADIYGSGNKFSIGAVGSIGGSRPGNFVVQNSDYILAVGTKLCSQLTGSKEKFAREAKITVIDIDPVEHTKSGIHIDKLVICDSYIFFDTLNRSPNVKSHDAWTERCLNWKEIFSIENEAFVRTLRNDDKIDIYSFANDIERIIPDDGVVITDAGFEELIVPSAIRYKSNQRCIFPAAQGAMGYAVPAIIGAYYAGHKNIFCIVGDGSIMMNIQELQIISSRKIPAKIFIINNGMYAVIKKRQKDLFKSRTIGNDPDDGVPAPNYKKIAYGFEIPYRSISKRHELLESLDSFAENQGPEIIEIFSVNEQNYLHESFAFNAKRKLVHRPIEDMAPFIDRELFEKEMIVEICDK